MRSLTIAALLSMVAGSSAFGIAGSSTRVSSTALFAGIPDEERTPEQMEIKAKMDRWAEIRLMSDEEAKENLSGDELESVLSNNKAIKEDIDKMRQLAEMMLKSVEPPKVAPKTKGQRKRDKWARKQALEAARAK
mmetsp:Transcript_18650/g.25698  ORF Transcript_18650/g.25698 Transcript_18650/m.25698 type:complete len:135 (-) Transcript_18650:175-579(-)|eukprot:CAMPEP_0185727618 /NCGR_PEP_ID=MMETSP1171-20130828/3251_1 /TAXON_ID=374046 /ORGANISM="Helicotheca tamensis, Strain CCMP826" /LENGTH=134 /DNA_ID=CAMNT_0028396219 /DNA_START=114 /DNA_END=518 /DNA_ORIENTATION=+